MCLVDLHNATYWPCDTFTHQLVSSTYSCIHDNTEMRERKKERKKERKTPEANEKSSFRTSI